MFFTNVENHKFIINSNQGSQSYLQQQLFIPLFLSLIDVEKQTDIKLDNTLKLH